MVEGAGARTGRWWLVVAVLTILLVPASAAAQIGVSAGLLIDREGSDGTRLGPSLTLEARHAAFPLFFEAGLARTDFTSLGQDYHDNHYILSLGAEWFPTDGATRVGLRLGLGAYGEYQTVETDPAVSGGDNWVEAVSPGLVLNHRLGQGRQVVFSVTDYVLGPWFAVLDPSEYGVEHRFVVTLGARF